MKKLNATQTMGRLPENNAEEKPYVWERMHGSKPYLGDLENTKTPHKFSQASFDDKGQPHSAIIKSCEQYALAVREGLSQSLVLLGEVGAGKTYLSWAICHALKPYYTHTTQLDMIGTIISAKFQKRNQGVVISDYAYSKLLVIDEVGLNPLDQHAKSYLDAVIDQRVQNKRPTIFISNFNKVDFFNFVGLRIADRIKGALIHEFNHKSLR